MIIVCFVLFSACVYLLYLCGCACFVCVCLALCCDCVCWCCVCVVVFLRVWLCLVLFCFVLLLLAGPPNQLRRNPLRPRSRSHARVIVRVPHADVRGGSRRPAGSGAQFPRRSRARKARAARARHARRVHCTCGACKARDPSFQIRTRLVTSSTPTVMSR